MNIDEKYQLTVKYIFDKLPMYHLIGNAAYKEDIGNITMLCEFNGNPQLEFKSVHIAGTNGKGSVSHMFAAIFKNCNYKTGLFTSPHLLDFRERIRINGKVISSEYVIDFVEKNKKTIEEIKPSFFEITAAMAFRYFADNGIDIAVSETGLGGRLDATNILQPELSVITNISLEHEHMLGNTLEKIAYEKGGIIKENTPVIIGERNPETEKVFFNIASKKNAEIFFAEDFYTYKFRNNQLTENSSFEITDLGNNKKTNIICDLRGSYQGKNITTVLKSIDILKNKNYLLPELLVSKAFSAIQKDTGLRGRWEILNRSPLIICDISHNSAAIKEAVNQLKFYDFNKLHIIFGLSADKNSDRIIDELPEYPAYYFCRSSVPRSMDPEIIMKKATDTGLKGRLFLSVEEGLNEALHNAGDKDLILITGSTFVVADALNLL